MGLKLTLNLRAEVQLPLVLVAAVVVANSSLGLDPRGTRGTHVLSELGRAFGGDWHAAPLAT